MTKKPRAQLPRPLTPKQARFAAEYVKDLNGTQAAIRAGYSQRGADVHGVRLLANARVAAEIAARTSKQMARAELSAVRVLEELRRLAFADPRDLFDEQGNLRPVHTLTAEQASAIASMEVVIKNAKAGDGVTDTIHKIKTWDKTKTLDLLARHFALLHDHVTVDVVDWAAIAATLAAARRRVEER